MLRARGTPLPDNVRVPLEKRFGRSLCHVHVHTDDLAACSAGALRAAAYAAGSHIVFGNGRYNPETQSGRWLLCHELAHVVQQDVDRGAMADGPGDALDLLERNADQAADLIAAGGTLPPGFVFGAAPAGIIQCHQDTPCTGQVITPDEPGRQGIGGNWAIELAYKTDPQIQDHVDALFFGSQYDGERFGTDVLLPKGAPNKAFGNMLLTRLRGLANQRRPDIIDFKKRVFYEIKTPRYVNAGMVQLESYYRVANEIIHEYARFHEPPWDRSQARWYPAHMLPYPGDWRAIVCTQETDHQRYPGLILYDIRRKPGRRRDAEDQRVTVFDTVRIDNDFAAIRPQLVEEAKKQIRYYDPNEPRYVIIIPRDIYKKWPRRQNELWDKLRVSPTYGDVPGASYVRHVKGQLAVVAAIVSVVGIALLIVVGGYAICAISAGAIAAAAAESAAAAQTAAVAETVAVTQAAAQGEVISLAAYRAAKAAPAVKALAKAAGVLFVLGGVSNADAETPTVDSVSAIRAVAVGDFELFGTPTAGSTTDGPVSSVLHTPEATRGKFELGSIVIYDHTEHIVIGQIGVR
jgi:hypothetical protein